MKTKYGKTVNKMVRPAFTVLVFAFAFSPTARAISPLPDGGYPDNNTAEGTYALYTFTGVAPNNGGENTAIGFEALAHNTTGDHNTATGFKRSLPTRPAAPIRRSVTMHLEATLALTILPSAAARWLVIQ